MSLTLSFFYALLDLIDALLEDGCEYRLCLHGAGIIETTCF